MEYLSIMMHILSCSANNPTFDIISSICAIGMLILGIITIFTIKSYTSQKRLDALYGFYKQLYYLLILFQSCICKIEENTDIISHNILYAFCEDNDRHSLIKDAQKKDYSFCRNGIIDLLSKSGNQIGLNREDVDAVSNSIEEIYKFLIDHNLDYGYKYTKNSTSDVLNKTIKEIHDKSNELSQLIKKEIGRHENSKDKKEGKSEKAEDKKAKKAEDRKAKTQQ